MASRLLARNEHFYSGNLMPAHSRHRIGVTNPATEERIGEIPDGDAVDVDRAVRAAREAFDTSGWPSLPPSERAAFIRALADALEARTHALAHLITSQIGMPLRDSISANGQGVSKLYRYYAYLAESVPFEVEVAGHGASSTVRREPVGVAALIVPWNGPQGAIAWKLAPALAAGCTTIIKPAPEASLDSYILAEAVKEVGLPDGVVNIVFGGGETGQYLSSHPDVDKVSFTGSTVAGRRVAAACAERFARVTLELGGKSAALLLEDFDLDTFTPFVASACVPFSGQICHALTRVLVPQSRYQEVSDRVGEAMSRLVVGDPLLPSTDIGPLVSHTQRDRVEQYLALARGEGARAVVGGGRPAAAEVGFFIEPTVFADVTPDMTIAQEEIFGPVISMIPYRDVEEAVRICNGTSFGLSSAIFTKDTEAAMGVARQIRAGTVGINHYTLHLDAPFGGVRASGIGRELGPEGLHAFLEPKTILHA